MMDFMTTNKKYKYVCIVCSKESISSQPKAKLCSEVCRENYYGRVQNPKNKNLSAGTVGAITELKVSSWLMENGYAVFRALSPSCFCDLIAIKDGESMNIEVRTGYISGTGNLFYPKNLSKINGIATHFAVYNHVKNDVTLIKI